MLTLAQAIAEISAGVSCAIGATGWAHSRNMPAIHTLDDGAGYVVHIGPNELATLATTRNPIEPRVFKTLDAAFESALNLCKLAGLEGFQRIEVCGHIEAAA